MFISTSLKLGSLNPVFIIDVTIWIAVNCCCGIWKRAPLINNKEVFATNSGYLVPISLQSDGLNLWYFKLGLFDLTEFIVYNI